MPVKELKAQGKKPKNAMNCVIGGIMIIFNLDYDLQITFAINNEKLQPSRAVHFTKWRCKQIT